MSRDNMKRLVERLHALWSSGDLSMIPSIYAPDFVGHMSATSGMGTLRGHGAVRNAIAGVRDAVSGFTETITDMIIEGDKVVTRYIVTGVHNKPFLGVAPTNQPIHVHEISIYQVRGGLIAEQWCGKVVND